jgi:histidine triad (HIT) family protein
MADTAVNKYDENNIFAKILRGEIPATKVYEDEQVLAFLDIMPVNPGHTLVISKTEKAALVEDLNPEALAAVIKVGKKVGHALRTSGLPCEGVNFWLSDGAAAGQEVPHAHLHVVPRYQGDGFHIASSAKKRVMQTPEELQTVQEKLKF